MDLDRPEIREILEGSHPLWLIRGKIRSGKSRILIQVARHFVDQGKRVLCVCASPSAGEVIRRETSPTEMALNRMRVYTPVRLCRELLSKSGHAGPRLLGPFDKWLILKTFLENGERYPESTIAFGSVVKKWMDLIAFLKAYGISYEALKIDKEDVFFLYLKKLYEEYRALLDKRVDWLDFEDERLRLCQFMESKDAGGLLIRNFGPDLPDLILLEDSNELTRLDAQMIGAFLKTLRDQCRPSLKVLAAVGTAGSLLKFRGGSPQNVEHLLLCLEPWTPKRIELDSNGYSRGESPQEIQEILRGESLHKQFMTFPFKRDNEEAEFVCHQIQKLVAEQDYSYEDIAVIFRTRDNFQDLLQWKFRDHGIPFQTQLTAVKPAAAVYEILRCMLTILLSPESEQADLAFMFLCNSFLCRFTPEDWKRIRRWMARKDTDTLEATATSEEPPEFRRYISFYKALEVCYPHIEDWETRLFLRRAYQIFDLGEVSCEGYTVSKLIRWIIHKTDMVRRLLKAYKKDVPGARFQMEGLNKVLEIAEIFDGIVTGESLSVRERLSLFLKELTEAMAHMNLTGPAQEETVRQSGVKIALVHEVQGETFRVIFLPCLAEGKFPAADMSLDSFLPDQRLFSFFRAHTDEELPWFASQEERERQESFLFQYAIKRGEEKVFASVATEYDRKTAIPSMFYRFLENGEAENPQEVLEELCSEKDFTRLLRNLYSGKVYVQEIENFLDDNPLELKRSTVLDPLATLRPLPSRGMDLSPDWSFNATDFRSILTCRRQFFYRRLLRIPIEPGYVTNWGNFVHGVMERFYAKYGSPDSKPAVCDMKQEEFEERFSEALREVAREDLINFEVAAEGLWCEQRLLAQAGLIFQAEDEYRRSGEITLPEELELKFKDLEVKHGDSRVLVAGKVDRISRLSSGKRTWVLDYKTGAPKDEKTLQKENLGGDKLDPDTGLPKDLKDLQLPIYYLWANDQGLPDPSIEIFFISYTKEGPIAQRTCIQVDPEDTPEIKRHVVTAAELVLSPGDDGGSQFVRNPDRNNCLYCAMNSRCKLLMDLRAHV